VPFDLAALTGWSDGAAVKLWSAILLAYCLVAGVLPVWLLLQPRGQLGGYFLYAALAAGALGLAFGNVQIEYPAFRGWNPTAPSGVGVGVALVPMLFITIACGACSGFHSLIASGTTSKQLRNELDAKPVAYGSMLLEGMVAVVSLCCVMMFAENSAELAGKPNEIYAHGIGKFLDVVRVSKGIGVTFALMAFTTFVYDTLDVCTRLGRFILQELTGWHGRGGRLFGTALTAGVPLFFMLRHPSDAKTPVWQLFLESVRREQSAARRAHAARRYRVAVADAAGDVGLVRHRHPHGDHVRDEHLGIDHDDSSGVSLQRRGLAGAERPGAVDRAGAARPGGADARGSGAGAGGFE
jgi:carbon starvation protein CstA